MGFCRWAWPRAAMMVLVDGFPPHPILANRNTNKPKGICSWSWTSLTVYACSIYITTGYLFHTQRFALLCTCHLPSMKMTGVYYYFLLPTRVQCLWATENTPNLAGPYHLELVIYNLSLCLLAMVPISYCKLKEFGNTVTIGWDCYISSSGDRIGELMGLVDCQVVLGHCRMHLYH